MRITYAILLLVQLSVVSSVSYAKCSSALQLQPDHPPQKLSDAGIFEDLTHLTPCQSVTEYTVNSPLWSDGAGKGRWIIVPGKIDFQPEDPWKFPIGTVLVKEFDLPASATQQIRVETRLLINSADDQWDGYSYQWQDDQKDAVLLPNFASKTYQVYSPGSPGGTVKQTWTFPSRQMCVLCHNSWTGYVLGVRTEQLNLNKPGSTANQLDQWNQSSFFSSKIESGSNYKKYFSLSSTNQSLENRVKSYFATNCSQCHQPGSPFRPQIDFRFKTPVASMNLIDQVPVSGEMGIPNGVLVRPGKKEASILWVRLNTMTAYRMPPLGSNELDQEGIALIGQWIDNLSPSKVSEKFTGDFPILDLN